MKQIKKKVATLMSNYRSHYNTFDSAQLVNKKPEPLLDVVDEGDKVLQSPFVKQMAQQVRRNRTLDFNANKTIDFKVAKMKDEIDTYKNKFNDLMATTRVILRNSPIEVMTGESSTSSTSNTNNNTDQQLSPKRTRNRDKKSSISRQSSQLEEELQLILTSPETENQIQVKEEISFLMEPIRLYMEEVPVEYFTVD